MTQDSRAQFEAWGTSQNQSGNTDRLQRKGDGYVFTTADIMWQAWQASEARIMAMLESDETRKIIRDAIADDKNTSTAWEIAKAAILAVKQKVEE